MLASSRRSMANNDRCHGCRDGDVGRETDNPTLFEAFSRALSIPVGRPVLGLSPEKNPIFRIQKRYFNVPARLMRKDLEASTRNGDAFAIIICIHLVDGDFASGNDSGFNGSLRQGYARQRR